MSQPFTVEVPLGTLHGLRWGAPGDVPVLALHPERLKLFVDEGHLVATGVSGLSFEYRYTLTLIFTDYRGTPDALMAPLLAWLRVHQRELFDNPERRDALRFEAEILDHERVDLELQLPLTERVGIHETAPGRYQIEHYPEPSVPGAYAPRHWQLYARDDLLAEWDSP